MITSNTVVRFADEANPQSYGFSTNVGGLANGERVRSVVQLSPPNSANAEGGSFFELLPSGAVFETGSASNYSIRYAPGLLVVLPRPPRIGDIETGGAGAADEIVGGGRAGYRFGDGDNEVGVTYVHDGAQGTGGDLGGADLRVELPASSVLTMEAASTDTDLHGSANA